MDTQPETPSSDTFADAFARARKAGIAGLLGSRPEAELESLLRGVLAGPEDHGPDAWMALLGASLEQPLIEALQDCKRALSATLDDGLDGTQRGESRLAALRAELKRRDLDGFIIPKSDEHLGEYVSRRAERLAWLTGFTGSAGTAVVLKDRAAVFSDGRYTLQLAAEIDTDHFEACLGSERPITDWISDHLMPGQRLGLDPWLHSQAGVESLRQAVKKVGGKLIAVETNPIDAVWAAQPPAPLSPVTAHSLEFSGRSSEEKRRQLAAGLMADKLDAVVISSPDSLAWLLNIRGGDVPFTPLALGFAVLHNNASVDLYMDGRKVTPSVREALGPDITIKDIDRLGEGVDELSGRRVRYDRDGSPAWISDRLARAKAGLSPGSDPCRLAKAIKNDQEIEGMRRAHRRDGLALSRFLAWLDRTAPEGKLTELDAADQLAAFRARGEHFRGLSFPTISGAGANGAIVHYRVSEKTNAVLEQGSLYLVDSGGQYLDGTTDVTRTIAIGQPDPEMVHRFTLVLKGHIAIARACFPVGTNGSQLDVLARQPLWNEGLDYDHGTGHGVGSYLSVHEGPQRISKAGGGEALKAGMILSNEPGYYKTGAYGIRIENLVLVTHVPVQGNERALLGFETLTLAPIDRRLIDPDLLTESEKAWINDYHLRVRTALIAELEPEDQVWLKQATEPLL